MMTIEQRIMAGEDPAKIMQEIELAKEKKAAAGEATEEQLKRVRAEVAAAVMNYMAALGMPKDALDEIAEAYTDETFKEIEFKVKLMIPLISMMNKAKKEPVGTSPAKPKDVDKIIEEFIKSL